jgi:hypothetical protein
VKQFLHFSRLADALPQALTYNSAMLFRLAPCVALLASIASARLVSIDVAQRTQIPGTNYERIEGKARFAVDPNASANQIISDIHLAPANQAGKVEFSADLCMLKPRNPARGNHAVIFEVSNRGGKGMLAMFDRATAPADLGDKLLLDKGYTIVWLGWEWDVPQKPELLRLEAPFASDHGKPVTGLVRAQFIPSERTNVMKLGDRAQTPYPVLEPGSLTVKDTPTGDPRPVARTNWTVRDGTALVMEGGFEPGKIYDFVYTAKDPVLVGLGPAGIRDLISYLKGSPDYGIRYAYGFGVSQSGRFLRKFVYDGFNADESGNKVFDGLLVHVAGAGLGSFNHRFAQPSRDAHPFMNVLYPTDIFPFTDLPETDPETGVTDSILAKAQKSRTVPKIFYTDSSYEYWGRCASLIHTTPDGAHDAGLADTTRIYIFSGGQHGPAARPVRNNTLNASNPNDYRWALRALLVAMDNWVRDGVAPPASVYPHVADGTLVLPDGVHFPSVAGEHVPATPARAYRLDFGPEFRTARIVTIEPPRVGDAFPIRVPQADADGIDLGGIRMPAVAVPVATYTGWNFRDASIGSPDQIFEMVGSFIPFPKSPADAAAAHDPRRPLSGRYSDRAAYEAALRTSARKLVADGFLLQGDVDSVVAQAAKTWDYAAEMR